MARSAVAQTGLLVSPVFSRAAPFALFMLFIAFQPLLAPHFDERWLAVARGLAVGVVLLALWPRFAELRHSPSAGMTVVSVAVGVAVFAAWIHLDSGWTTFDMGHGFVPRRADGSLDVTLSRCASRVSPSWCR